MSINFYLFLKKISFFALLCISLHTCTMESDEQTPLIIRMQQEQTSWCTPEHKRNACFCLWGSCLAITVCLNCSVAVNFATAGQCLKCLPFVTKEFMMEELAAGFLTGSAGSIGTLCTASTIPNEQSTVAQLHKNDSLPKPIIMEE